MEILRIAENIGAEGVGITIQIPGNHLESEHTITVTDLSDFSVSSTTTNATGGTSLTFYLNEKYDNSYLVNVLLESDIIFSEEYSLVRPYVNPNSLGVTASEIAEYTRWETIARTVIDNYASGINFYNKKTSIQTPGTNSDYLPIWKNVNKVLKVYENSVLIYDCENPQDFVNKFGITADKTAIYRTQPETVNNIYSPTIKVPASSGDLATAIFNYGAFPQRYDYLFVVDEGFLNIPTNIVYAAEMLIDDLKCGRLDYYQRYITSYNTDQFKIQFDKSMLRGTGNIIVDKILDKYAKSIKKVGVL